MNIEKNELSLDLITTDFDISENSLDMIELNKNNDKKKNDKENIEVKNKPTKKKVIIKHSVEEFQEKTQKTLDFFSKLNQKK